MMMIWPFRNDRDGLKAQSISSLLPQTLTEQPIHPFEHELMPSRISCQLGVCQDTIMGLAVF